VRRLEASEEDYFPGLTSEQKKDKLSRMSYKKFLLEVVKSILASFPSIRRGLIRSLASA